MRIRPLKLTPAHLHFHAAHTWLKRTGSLESAAAFLNVSLQWTRYHLANLPCQPPPLSWQELGQK